MKTRFSKKLISLLAALCMMLALIPAFTIPATAATEVTMTFVSGTSQNDNKRYILYFNLAGATPSNSFWNNNTVYIDGVAHTGSGVNFGDAGNGTLALYLTYEHLEPGQTTAANISEHLVHIKAGTPLSSSGYTIANDIYLKVGSWYVNELTPITISNVTPLWHGGLYRYEFLFKTSQGTLSTSPAMTAYIDGVKTTGLDWIQSANAHSKGEDSRVLINPSHFGYQNGAAPSDGVSHTVEFRENTIAGNYVLLNTLTYTVKNTSIQYVPAVYRLNLVDATAKMGGSYGTNVYYDVLGSFSAANWVVNETPTAGDIHFNYVVNTETRTAGGVYGVTRMIGLSNNYAIVNGVVDFIVNNGTGTWTGTAGGNTINLYYNATTHRRTLNNTIKWGYATSSHSAITCDGNGDDGVTTGYETADAAGAQYFGVAWGGGTYTFDWTKVQVYDANNNDLGVQHHNNGCTFFTATRVAVEDAKVYVQPTVKDGFAVTGLTTAEGVALANVTDEGNGIWSFTMPPQAITVSPVYEEAAPPTLSIVGLGGHVAAQGDPNLRFIVGLKTDVEFTAALDANLPITVTINGESKKVNTAWLAVSGVYYRHLLLPYSSYPKGTTYTITVPAGTVYGDKTTAEDFTFYIHDNNAINTTKPKDPVNIYGLGVHHGPQDNLSRYLASLVLSFPYEGGTPSLPVTVNGQSYTVSTFDSDDEIGLIFPYETFPKGSAYEIVVSAGTSIDGRKLAADFTFYIHPDGTVNTTRPSALVETVTMSSDPERNPTAGANGFYFWGSGDSLAYSDDWSVRYGFTTGGIYVNDTPVSGAKLVKINDGNLYYVAFDGCGVTPFADGTIVTIEGTVESLFHRVVFEQHKFIYREAEGWSDCQSSGTLELHNASAMMGGTYGDAIYYDLSGSYGSANWIVNAIPTDGNITFSYVVNNETRTAGGVYGVTRMIETNSYWAVENGVIDFIVNGAAGTWTGTAGTNSIKLFYNATTHRRLLNNSIKWGFATSAHPSITCDDNGDDGVTTGYETADAAGAQYFGVAWGGGTYDIDWTKVQVYDAEGNDLGVQWHDNAANAALVMMVEYDKTIYLKATPKTDKYGTALAVTGWKVTDIRGKELTVNATENNGVWSFVVPQDAAKMEPIYQTTSLTITVGGETIKTDNVVWTDDALAQAGIYAGEGQKLLGYVYNGQLYSSLVDINTASAAAVSVEAMLVDFEVRAEEEIRVGKTMQDSGLRFVATITNLYDGAYVVEKGFLLATADKAKAGLTLETEGVLNISSQAANYVEVTSIDDTDSYSIALVDIDPNNYNLAYAARAYFVVRFADGSTTTIYSHFDSSENSTTVFEVASASGGAVANAYVDGVIDITVDGELIGNRSYDVNFDKTSYTLSYDYTPAYGGASYVQALCINGIRMTEEDGVVFADGLITIPSGLFAMAMLEEEVAPTRSLAFNAYGGPSSGWVIETGSDGVRHEYQKTRATVEDLKDYFDAGFTVWSADSWWCGQDKDGNGKEDYQDALDLMAEYCLTYNKDPKDYKVLLHDSYFWGLMSGDDTTGGDPVYEFRTTEWQVKYITARIFGTGEGDFGNILGYANYVPVVDGVEYPEYNCFGGLTLRDEPFMTHMASMTEWFNFLAADTDQTVTVHSILSDGTTGSYTTKALGMLAQDYTLFFSFVSPAEKKYIVGGTSNEQCTAEEYDAYVNAFMENVNDSCWKYDNMYLAFSNYPYQVNYTIKRKIGGTNVTENEYYNSVTLSKPYYWAKNNENGARLMMAVQSFGYIRPNQLDRVPGWTSPITTPSSCDDLEGMAEVQGQIYQGMALGIEEFNYFTYWRHYNGSNYNGETHTQSCVYYDSNGNAIKDDMYYWVKDTNQEMLKFKDVYTSFDWQEAGYFAGNTTQTLSNMDDLLAGATNLLGISSLAGVNGSVDTVVGYFTKDSGDFRSAYMVVNAHNARDNKADTVTLTFDDASVTDVIVYLDGSPKMMAVTNGSVTLTLGAGEGAFVVPVMA